MAESASKLFCLENVQILSHKTPQIPGEKLFFSLDDSSSIQNSGLHGRPALHMILEGVDPATGITVARSYFLNNGIEPMEIVDPEALVERAYEDEEEDGEESVNNKQKAKQDNLLKSERNDVQCLARIYNALVNGLKSICESKCAALKLVEFHSSKLLKYLNRRQLHWQKTCQPTSISKIICRFL